MAIGPRPRYAWSYALTGLTSGQALVIAVESAARMGWRLHYVSRSGFLASSSAPQAQIAVRIGDDAIQLESASIVQEWTDSGRNKEIIRQFIRMLEELRAMIPGEQLEARYDELQLILPPPQADALLRRQPEERSALGDIAAIFRPVKDYFVTPVILNLNLLVFALMLLSGVHLIEPASADLLAWGANHEPYILQGQWWRLLTSVFVHIGAVHLLMNMYAFLLIGAQLEPRLGKARFMAAYLLSGVAASLTSLWWHDAHSISAGASGAIFGMYGVFLVMLRANLVEKSRRRQLLASILFFIVYNLLGGLQAGIDNAAHIGGLAAGIVISLAFVPALRKEKKVLPDASVAEAAPEPVKQDDYY